MSSDQTLLFYKANDLLTLAVYSKATSDGSEFTSESSKVPACQKGIPALTDIHMF